MKKNFFFMAFSVLFTLIFPETFFGAESTLNNGIAVYKYETKFHVDKELSEFPDEAAVRVSLWKEIFESELKEPALISHKVFTADNGKKWRFWAEDRNTHTAYIFSPEQDNVFSSSNQGTWIAFRDNATGKTDRIRIILRSKYSCYLDFTPKNNQTVLNLYALNALYSGDVTISLDFTSVYKLEFSQIYRITGPMLMWNYCSPDLTMYRNNRNLDKKIRQNLSRLTYNEDSCFDEKGNPVRISDGEPSPVYNGVNCSGFLKWVVDGMVYPVIGQGLFVEPLKTKTVVFDEQDFETNPIAVSSTKNYSRIYEPERDPFFGLDWSRNLAAAAASVFCGRNLTPEEAGTDVKKQPFQLCYDSKGKAVKTTGYMKQMGYSVKILESLLYALAIDEPDTVFLGSLNKEMTDTNGKNTLRQHYHTVVFVPYFTADGGFTVSVFESGTETTIAAFIEKHSEEFVHLTRIGTPSLIYFKAPVKP